ncbi:[FeFe] hydrogenase H-cluster maturation GTPase HydF [bacterium]|nr:[FeFe] hydrogenase H-cluster maturation GTPase HydF [bacterium]
MIQTARGDRLHIGIFGKRNAGKSSLINAIVGHEVAIVSNVAGTTTDPVYKSFELQPIGPVVFIDTAGIDDEQAEVGAFRVKKAEKVLSKSDMVLLVCDVTSVSFSDEDALLALFEKKKIPFIIVANKCDASFSSEAKRWFSVRPFVRISALKKEGITELKQRIIEIAPADFEPPFVADLIHPGEVVLLVAPIDLGAPKGRLILPQVKALRDILDADAIPMMCKERELQTALSRLAQPPALVITDSQVFAQVAADVPLSIPMTSFSILSIRQKGDLKEMVDAVKAVDALRPGDKVLIAESCSHHPLEDDIGRVKIPRWLNEKVGGGLIVETVPGAAFPDNLAEYKLVVHCGGCTLNRREMLRRQSVPMEYGVPMTNYGVLISYLLGVFPRALEPFGETFMTLSNKKIDIDNKIRRAGAVFGEV